MVWRAATTAADRAVAAASPAEPHAEDPTALASQLFALRAPDGVFPLYMANRLWQLYDAADAGATSSDGFVAESTKAAVAAAFPSHDAHQVAFFVTIAQLGVDLQAMKREAEALTAALQDLPTLNSNELITNHGGKYRKALAKAAEVRERSQPLHERWFHRTLALPDGAKRLITMRADLLRIMDKLGALVTTGKDAAKTQSGTSSTAALALVLEQLKPVEAALSSVLREWCSVAWLVVDEMTWARTPAMVVEKVMQHEAVHRFSGLEDVKRRMHPSPNRAAFAYFHPAALGEPLAMVVVALTKGIADNVDSILNSSPSPDVLDFTRVPHSFPVAQPTTGEVTGTSPSAYDTAIFYSITSTQDGLRGIELGNSLIKSVVHELQRSRPSVKQFSTLSPIPGYGSWLERHVADFERGGSVSATAALTGETLAAAMGITGMLATSASSTKVTVTDDDARRVVAALAECGLIDDSSKSPSTAVAVARAVLQLLRKRQSVTLRSSGGVATPWWQCEQLTAALQPLLMASVRSYLVNVKRRGRAFDPVANFHLRNGASLHRLNWLANCTARASGNSGCIMVNYLYDLPLVEATAAQYVESGIISMTTHANV
jgi:malonyl-CoA decarboxylase